MDSVGPAFEFNWGAVPRVQLHAILSWGVVAPRNNPAYLPSGTGPTEFGLTDMEVGAKIAFIKESKHVPQIGTFTMFELPTGNSDRGWASARSGTRFRNFPYTGWLVKRELSERLELGAEVFAHGAEGSAAAQTKDSTMIDVGGYYHFKHHPGQQFLFAYGHSVAEQSETYAYLGLYWTWGRGKDNKDAGPKPSEPLFPSHFSNHGF
jgi:hypothetical protein